MILLAVLVVGTVAAWIWIAAARAARWRSLEELFVSGSFEEQHSAATELTRGRREFLVETMVRLTQELHETEGYGNSDSLTRALVATIDARPELVLEAFDQCCEQGWSNCFCSAVGHVRNSRVGWAEVLSDRFESRLAALARDLIRRPKNEGRERLIPVLYTGGEEARNHLADLLSWEGLSERQRSELVAIVFGGLHQVRAEVRENHLSRIRELIDTRRDASCGIALWMLADRGLFEAGDLMRLEVALAAREERALAKAHDCLEEIPDSLIVDLINRRHWAEFSMTLRELREEFQVSADGEDPRSSWCQYLSGRLANVDESTEGREKALATLESLCR